VRQIEFFGAADDGQRRRGVDAIVGQLAMQAVHAGDRAVVEGDDQVAVAQPGARGGLPGSVPVTSTPVSFGRLK
jgi:hypothetical protein